MSPDHFLILAPHVECICDGELFCFEAPVATVRISGMAPALKSAFKRLKDGVPASALHLPAAIVESLVAHGIVCRVALEPSSANIFLSDFFAVCDVWVEGIFHSLFWPRFMAGQSSKEEVFAFLAQLYHRTAGADWHNRIAFERCKVPAIRLLLEQHYHEELGHASILAEGLRRCGARAEALVRAQPFPATRQLIAYMVEMSVEPFSYLGCYGIFHAPSTVRTEADLILQFSQFARMYPFAAPGFEAVCKHACLDYRLEHDQILLERWLWQTGPPQAAEVAALLCGARGAARAFRAVFDGLVGV